MSILKKSVSLTFVFRLNNIKPLIIVENKCYLLIMIMTPKRKIILSAYIGFILSINLVTLFAQDSNIGNHEQIYQYLMDSSDNLVGTNCGIAGIASTNLKYAKTLFTDNRIDLLIKLLDSKIPATQYLAIQSLLLVDSKNLDSLTITRLAKLKKSKDAVGCCNGCFAGGIYTINKLINDKKNGTGKSIRNYLLGKKEE